MKRKFKDRALSIHFNGWLLAQKLISEWVLQFTKNVNKYQFKRFYFKFLVILLVAASLILTVSLGKISSATSGEIQQFQSSAIAQELDRKGHWELQQGQTEEALTSFKQAEAAYGQVDDKNGAIGSQLNQAQALQVLGQYLQAKKLLMQVNETLKGNSLLKIKALRSYGDVLRLTGDLENSRIQLENSLQMARTLPSIPDISAAQLSLGNTALAIAQREKNIDNETKANEERKVALEFYQQAATSEASGSTKLEAQLNWLNLLVATDRTADATLLLLQIQNNISQLPLNRVSVIARINLAGILMDLKQNNIINAPNWRDIAQILATAVEQAKSLKNERLASYALGYLGKVYEQNQQWEDAIKLTRQALGIAQSIQGWDIAYQWQWQWGRLLVKKRERKEAIALYFTAVESLKSVRENLLAINPEAQFSFRDEVEPVYRELVDLLLPSPGNKPEQNNLDRARKVIADLQVAEIENFLRCSLQTASEKTVPLDEVANKYNAAVIYPIILPQKLAVIVKLPNQSQLLYYENDVKEDEVKSKLKTLRRELQRDYISEESKRLSEELYDWLIEPAETYPETPLDPKQVQTLVFVLDSYLRNIPMAALRDRASVAEQDRDRYLVEKYAVALNLGLELPNPQPFREKQREFLTAAITQQIGEFSPLKYAGRELDLINQVISTRELRDEKFKSTNLRNSLQLRPFSVVHLATHGKFSSQPEETAILAWDKLLNVNELSDIFRTQSQAQPNPIELLVLSACQTATGDRRAVLGLAGVAVRSGARSTIASLWYVNDKSSAILMERFYQNLTNPNISSKAEALRRAQEDLIKDSNYGYKEPLYWAAYVLVGNWL